MKQKINTSIFWTIYIAVFSFFISCTHELSEIRKKNIGPYIFAGIELKIDYRRTQFKLDSLKQFFDFHQISSGDAFGVFRDSLNSISSSNSCMLGFIIDSPDSISTAKLKQLGFVIQEMGCTQSLYLEYEVGNFLNFSNAGKEVSQKLNHYLKSNTLNSQPILCIFGDDCLQFSMEIRNAPKK